VPSAKLGLGDPDSAQPLFERALQSLDRGLERDAFMATYPLLGLARIHQLRGNHDGAEQRFRRVIQVREERVGQDHPELVPALRHFAGFLRERGRVQEATR
jgi:hypothetical protein